MAINKKLTPDVSGIDLDAFVNSGKTNKETANNKKSRRKAVKRLAKSKDSNYHKLTLYLPVELISQLKTCVASEIGKDISDISAELYGVYINKTMRKLLNKYD